MVYIVYLETCFRSLSFTIYAYISVFLSTYMFTLYMHKYLYMLRKISRKILPPKAMTAIQIIVNRYKPLWRTNIDGYTPIKNPIKTWQNQHCKNELQGPHWRWSWSVLSPISWTGAITGLCARATSNKLAKETRFKFKLTTTTVCGQCPLWTVNLEAKCISGPNQVKQRRL